MEAGARTTQAERAPARTGVSLTQSSICGRAYRSGRVTETLTCRLSRTMPYGAPPRVVDPGSELRIGLVDEREEMDEGGAVLHILELGHDAQVELLIGEVPPREEDGLERVQHRRWARA